jgi:hypothetical protein
MNKRKDHIARVTRKTLPKSEVYVTDLWGNTQVKMSWCSFHKKYEDCRLFYTENVKKAKGEYKLRRMCIEGWDLTNGNAKIQLSMNETLSTLENYYD